jgi:cell division septal protein FtsQ
MSGSFVENLEKQLRTRKVGKKRKVVRSPSSRQGGIGERNVPPVLIRGASFGDISWQPRSRGKSKPRRRYDVALNMPGVEMRLPSLPQVAVGWRLASFLLVAALGLLLYHLWSSPQYRIQTARIIGLQRLTSQDVNAVLNVRDERIFAIDPDILQKKLMQAFPEFSKVDVKVNLPGEVIVKIDERQPILTWRQDGRTILVDANGVSFPMRDDSSAMPAVIVEAHGSPPVQEVQAENLTLEQFMPVEMVSAILSMNAQVPAGTSLSYDPQRGLGWKDAQGWEVYFGDTRNMDMKLRLYRAILEKLDKDDIMPALISVEHVHLPYYRLER